MEHTKACKEATERVLKKQKEFDEKYPNYCRECGGWGGKTYYENHGLPGPAEQLFEPCGKCLENDVCPRCGHPHEQRYMNAQGDYEPWFNDVYVECVECGWSEETECGRPELDYCFCDAEIWIEDIPF